MQLSLLSLLGKEKSRLGAAYASKYPTIIFVHVVNPYGMHNIRRVNEDNIDINRNFLSEDQFSEVVKRDPDFAGYQRTDFIFNPSKRVSSIGYVNDVYTASLAVYGSLVYGIGFLKR